MAILGLIKLSLIMFYLDVFPTRSFKIAGWIVFWYISVNTLIIFLLTVFACTPVSAFWNRDIKGKVSDRRQRPRQSCTDKHGVVHGRSDVGLRQ